MASTVVSISVHRPDESPIFGESSTIVSLDDEGGGPFIVLTQHNEREDHAQAFDLEELREVLAAAEQLIGGWPAEL